MPITEDLQGEWHSKVYAPAKEHSDDISWKALEKEIIRRDRKACKSCGGKLALTVHHIKPRSEGGSDMPDNLITLCKYCHDEIEQLGLKNKLEIIDFKRKRKYIKYGPRQVETETATNWHQWVYGGYRNPNK